MEDYSDETVGYRRENDIQCNESIEMNSNAAEVNSQTCNERSESDKECTIFSELTQKNPHTSECASFKDSSNPDEVSNLASPSELNGNTTQKSNNNSPSNDAAMISNQAEKDLDANETSKSLDDNSVEMLMDAELADDALVISNANARPLSQNITQKANNSLLLLSQYGSDESLDEDEVTPTPNLNYREENKVILESDKDSDSDSSSTSSSSSVLISDSSDTESDIECESKPQKLKPIKSKGELELADLPPIEDLQISIPLEECKPIGKIFQIVDVLVVVQAIKNSPAYDVDTVLFLDGGRPLGKIFEVFGPVCEPHYCIRFNSQEHIKERNIALEQMVYCAPKNTEFTKFVFMSQLMKMKGTDASWVDDFETPENLQDYSDDEQEQMAKKNKSRSGKATPRVESDPEEPARKKHFAYEKRMNERNLQLSTISNRRFNNNQQSLFDSPSSSSVGLRNPSPRLREFIRHRFGSMPSFSPGMSNHFIPNGPRICDSNNFIQNFQPNIPNTGASHSPHAFMSQWSPLSGPYADPRSQPFSPPMSSPFIQNQCPRPNVPTSHCWNLPPMQSTVPHMSPIGTHPPSLPMMSTPPPNIPPGNSLPPNHPSMATPPPNMPPMRSHPPNIPLMGTPPPNMPPMSTPPPSNVLWNPDMFFSSNLNNTSNPMQRNLIRPPSLPSPSAWSFYTK